MIPDVCSLSYEARFYNQIVLLPSDMRKADVRFLHNSKGSVSEIWRYVCYETAQHSQGTAFGIQERFLALGSRWQSRKSLSSPPFTDTKTTIHEQLSLRTPRKLVQQIFYSYKYKEASLIRLGKRGRDSVYSLCGDPQVRRISQLH